MSISYMRSIDRSSRGVTCGARPKNPGPLWESPVLGLYCISIYIYKQVQNWGPMFREITMLSQAGGKHVA